MKKLTTEEYKNILANIGASVEPIEEYILSLTPIKHICLDCGNIIKIAPNRVIGYTKKNICICQKCSGMRLYVGKNDLWTTNPEIAKLLKHPEDGYRLTRRCDKKADWICPDCGFEIKQKTVNNTTTNGLVCPLCSNTRSLGHRLVNAMLAELNIDFLNEKSFYWSDGKSYDIYIEDFNCIIEVNGIQHYEECALHNMSGKTLKDEIVNDKHKRDIAISNGIQHYIYIDARKSDIDYIIQSIKNNKEFNILFDTTNISWENVIKNSSGSDIMQIKELFNKGKTVPEIQKIVHMSNSVVQQKLHALTKYGLCNYKGDEEMFKPVICLNTR